MNPQNITQLQDIVRSKQKLLAVGARTKTALSSTQAEMQTIIMVDISGIIEYQPDEYTFTAYAGTPLQDIQAALAEHNQYLPFDPMFAKRGATLGGTIASNLNGAGRYQYGGIRDFILGVHFIDGNGNLIKGGGKVVKNSAGFDTPKFMVGSLGRFGILTEATFKVFPAPPDYHTLRLSYNTLNDAMQVIFKLATKSFEINALDIETESNQYTVIIRLGGSGTTLRQRVSRLLDFLIAETSVQTTQTIEADTDYWNKVNNAAWLSGSSLIKIPISPRQALTLDSKISHFQRRYSSGGNTAWIGTDNLQELDQTLASMNLTGLKIFGTPDQIYLGSRKGLTMMKRVKQALDPQSKFPEA